MSLPILNSNDFYINKLLQQLSKLLPASLSFHLTHSQKPTNTLLLHSNGSFWCTSSQFPWSQMSRCGGAQATCFCVCACVCKKISFIPLSQHMGNGLQPVIAMETHVCPSLCLPAPRTDRQLAVSQPRITHWISYVQKLNK